MKQILTFTLVIGIMVVTLVISLCLIAVVNSFFTNKDFVISLISIKDSSYIIAPVVSGIYFQITRKKKESE